MTSDFPIVACSVLLRTALRGAATGVGSLEWGVVLITNFSGSIAGFVFGLVGVELAGFHMFLFPFRFLVGAVQPATFRPLLLVPIGNWEHQLRMTARS